jgi:cytochrome b6-f complex iron-sulfur subunit
MIEAKQTRRSFLNWVLGGGVLATVGAIVYPAWRFITPPPSGEANVSQVKLPFKRADLAAEPQKAKTFKFGRTVGIIVLTDSGELKALSASCTHLDCTVQHRPDLGILWCACHNGRYDLDGKNISGPPPRPLEKYAVNEVGEDIFVAKEKV